MRHRRHLSRHFLREPTHLPISSKNKRQGPRPCLGASQGSCIRPPRGRSVIWCCWSVHQGGNAPHIYRQGYRVSRREILRGERSRRRALAMAKSPPRPRPIRVDSSAIFFSGLGFDTRMRCMQGYMGIGCERMEHGKVVATC